jgi:hypothetical protein
MANDIESISYINIGDGVNHPIDAMTVGGKTIPDSSSLLPTISGADNGKVLRVINGQWTLVDPAVIYFGEGNPDDTDGNDGDIYIKINSQE